MRDRTSASRGTAAGPPQQRVVLLVEVHLARALGGLEEEAERPDGACFAAPLREQREAGDVDHEGRGEHRVGALPGELHAHAMSAPTTKLDEVPRDLVVAERLEVVDAHVALGGIAEDSLEHALLRRRSEE